MRMSILLISLLLAGQATADDTPRPAGALKSPVPPAAMVAFLQGHWAGEGAFASGKKIEAEVEFSLDLNGQWLSYRHTDRPPGRYRAAGMWGYTKEDDRFVMTLNDSGGGFRKFQSDGWTDNGIVFERQASATSMERFVFRKQDGGRFKMIYEIDRDGQGWKMVDYLVFVRSDHS